MARLPGATAAPSPSVADAFSWAARDPEWITKLLLMGLIGLIPVVGALQQTGWLLAMLDNLRAGRSEVPPAGFRYATRGVWLWLASVIWVIIFVAVLYGVLILFFVGLSLLGAFTSGDHGSKVSPVAFLIVPFFFIWFAFIGLVSLVLWIFVPAVIELTDRKGLGGAFDVAGIIHAVRVDPLNNLAAAALAFVAYFISGLGTYACFIGVIFTAPYALTVLAGILRWYEVNLRPEALPAPATAASAR